MNTSFVRVKRPESFKLVWPLSSGDILDSEGVTDYESVPDAHLCDEDESCSIWFPEAPKGYVALGCVVSPGRTQPPLSSVFCILASLVSPCSLRDCITISSRNLYVEVHLYRVLYLLICMFLISISCEELARRRGAQVTS